MFFLSMARNSVLEIDTGFWNAMLRTMIRGARQGIHFGQAHNLLTFMRAIEGFVQRFPALYVIRDYTKYNTE